ncbi:MAG: tyrosine-protein phosphatase [Oscillospiraceae bacterium]
MKTLTNFRDIGGYVGADGRKVKRCRLLRSAEPVNLSPSDKNELVIFLPTQAKTMYLTMRLCARPLPIQCKAICCAFTAL